MNYNVPENVRKIVLLYIADYPRRQSNLKLSNLETSVATTSKYLNKLCDEAFSKYLETGIEDIYKLDTIKLKSYYQSESKRMLSINTYYARRKKIVYFIADRLGLI